MNTFYGFVSFEIPEFVSNTDVVDHTKDMAADLGIWSGLVVTIVVVVLALLIVRIVRNLFS